MDLITEAVTTAWNGIANDISWNPESDMIGFRIHDSTNGNGLAVVPAIGGSITMVRRGGFNADCAWSPIGDEFVARGDSGIVLIAYPSGDLSSVTCSIANESCVGEGPTWSPDGAWIAFEDSTQILRVPRAGGNALVVVDERIDVSDPSWSPDGKWIAFSELIDLRVQGPNGPLLFDDIWIACAWEEESSVINLTYSDTARYGSFVYTDNPHWMPDMSAVFFESANNRIWKVNLTW